MQQRSGVLTMTDLTERSDGALQLAGTLAARNAWDLEILCPLGGTAGLNHPEFSNRELGRSIRTADRAARLQATRLLPQAGRASLAPIIDLESPERALLRRAVQLRPWLAVLPPIWTWAHHDRGRPALDAATLARCGMPILIAAATAAQPSRRTVILSVPEAFDAAQIRTAWRWRSWLQRMLDTPGAEDVPEVDVILCDAGDDAPAPGIDAAAAALVLVTAEVQIASRDRAPIAAALAALLREAAAPILLLPAGAAVPRVHEEVAQTRWDHPPKETGSLVP